jgi:cytochrome c-type biogenesis protein CcmH
MARAFASGDFSSRRLNWIRRPRRAAAGGRSSSWHGHGAARSLRGGTVSVMKVLLSVVAALAAVALFPGAAAGAPQASLPDIEDEVMCPTCGLPLAHSFSPQAEREREFILTQIESGKDKEQIKQALVAEFGSEVLAEPNSGESGFDIAAFLVPAAVVGGGLIAIWVAVARWRRRERGDGTPAVELNAADSARLEQDLSRYDP